MRSFVCNVDITAGPFTETRTVLLTLTNIKDAPVCFKVKTTAPKQYCVRPNAGVVEPRASADVQSKFLVLLSCIMKDVIKIMMTCTLEL